MHLCSDPAEGLHRDTRLSKIRAPFAKAPWILSTTRLPQIVPCVNSWLETPEGAAVFTYEYQHFTRILQVRPSHQYQRKKCGAKETVARVYRLHDHRYTDWSFLGDEANPDDAAHKHEQVEMTVEFHLKNDYLKEILQVGEYYSIPREGEDS